MTAAELPVGAQFTFADSTDETVYTVTHQVPGASPHAHLTYATYGGDIGHGSVIAKHCVAWAGHTEVIAVPDARATGDSTP